MATISRSQVESLLGIYGSSGYVSELRATVYQTEEGKCELTKEKLLFDTRDALKEKMKDHGVNVQWIQLYEFNSNRIRARINFDDKTTLSDNFKEIRDEIFNKFNIHVRITKFVDIERSTPTSPQGCTNVMIQCS